MKSGLKRIEATLDQLHTQQPTAVDFAAELPIMAPKTSQDVPKSFTANRAKPTGKTIQPFPIPQAAPVVLPPNHSAGSLPPSPSVAKPTRSIVKAKRGTAVAKPTSPAQPPFPTRNSDPETPTLPKSKPPSFSSHRHAANPNLAVGILKEVESVVVKWQLALEQTVLEIQALYMEGPIVDGWLESHPVGSPQVMQPIGTAMLRHAEIDRLMEYVEEICRVPQTLDGEQPRTGYRLCGLDAEGQLWSRPCPAQQVPYVGLAIARYQKLRILLAQKQTLENRLNQLVQSLTLLHGQIQSHV